MVTSDTSENDSTEPNSTQFKTESGGQHNATGKSNQLNGNNITGNMYFGVSQVKEESEGESVGRQNISCWLLLTQMPGEIRQKLRVWLLGNSINERHDASIPVSLKDDACSWILKNKEFLSWQSDLSSSPKLFWIHGPAGFGKTVICARIIEHITRPQVVVAHHFFSSDIENHRDPMVAMQSWIYHIALKDKLVATTVNKAWRNEPPSQAVIIELFQEVIKTVSNCTLVVDGLNECVSESSCQSVTKFINKLNEAVRGTKTRILVMSRSIPSIRQALMEAHSAEFSDYQVSEKDVRSDIEAYSKHIVAQKLRDKDTTVQDDMARKMSDQSQGQFDWLKLQHDSIPRGLSQEQFQNALGGIPATLSELYDRSWKKIIELQPNEQDRAISLLRLATFSIRDLTVREISEAMLVSEEHEDFPTHLLPKQWNKKFVDENILDLCFSLLDVTKPSEECPVEEWTIHTIHPSIEEFLLRSSTKLNPLQENSQFMIAAENSFLAKQCITYMGYSYAWQNSTGDETPSSGSFTSYAANFWNKHAQAGTDQKDILIEKFFDEKSFSWTKWRNWFDSTNSDWAKAKSDHDPAIPLCYVIELEFVDLAMVIIQKGEKHVYFSSKSRTALGVACSKGYEYLARKLLAHRAKVDTRDAHGRTAVFYAAMNGHSELVKLLVENGANINIRDDNGVSPFLAASSNGHLDTMRRLIQKGTNVYQLDKDGNGALFKASSNGHLDAARFLIEKGVHLQLSSYTTPPVFEALRNGSFHLIRLLIEKETNLNATSRLKRLTILHVAISEGRTNIVKLLVKRGVNLTQQDAEGRTPLFMACLHGRIEILRLLITKEEVDTTTPNKEGKTPLYVACVNSHLNAANLLITHVVNIESSDTKGYAPLFGAASGGSLEIVQMLTNAIENAADVSIVIRNRAILAASEGGHVDILKWLIEWIGDEIGNLKYEWKVDNITVECNIMDRALLLALGLGHAHVVALLLDKGANPNHSGPQGQTPLYAACRDGHLEVAKVLIGRDASIKATEKEGQTPLMAACANGCLDLVKLLLEEGANVNTLNKGEMGAAFVAAQCGHLEVLRLLHAEDADIFRKNTKGMLPIHAASQNGRSTTVGFLIEKGSDVTVANKDDETPLWLASLNGHVDVVGVLLKHGVDVDAKDTKGRASLLIASSKGDTDLAKLLLKNCANISIKDDNGQTPLYCASANGRLGVVKLLLDHGADMTPNKEGETPAYVASSKGCRFRL